MEDFLQFLSAMEFKSMLNQKDVILRPFMKGQSNGNNGQLSVLNMTVVEPEVALPEDIAITYHEVPHQIITDKASLEAFIQKIKQTGVMSIDVETSGLDYFTAILAGIAISWSPTLSTQQKPTKNLLNLLDYPSEMTVLKAVKSNIETVYIPMTHVDLKTDLTYEDVLAELKPILEDPAVTKIMHNAKYEINIFRNHHIFLKGLFFDTMITSYVLNTDRRHGLKALAHDVMGCRMREITELIGKGKSQIPFTETPVEEAARYAACDSHLTLQLAEKFIEELDDELESLLYEVELPLVSVLADMEWNGVSLDQDYLKVLSDNLQQSLIKVEAEIYEMAGVQFNLNSPKQVGDVLFEKLQIPTKGYTPSKSAFTTSAKVLELLAPDYPVVEKLLDYRQLFKLKSTYIDALPQLISTIDHRLHTSFNQTIAGTGRLSSSEPNLQNIPIRTELGRSIRQGFVPRDRTHWTVLSADYSQIELRLLAHFSEDPELVKAFQAREDIHQATAALVFDVPLDQVTKEMRYRAKAVNFGIIYGQTAYGLSKALKIPIGEAASFIERYFERYPKVKTYIETAKAELRRTGKVKTLLGRRRDFSEGLQSQIKQQREFAERAAFNLPLQGSAADLMKLAMIRLHDALRAGKYRSQLIIQVHDELVLEVFEDEREKLHELVRWAMALDQPLLVPLEIDISDGPTWMEA
jgi:DNA polymerase-1